MVDKNETITKTAVLKETLKIEKENTHARINGCIIIDRDMYRRSKEYREISIIIIYLTMMLMYVLGMLAGSGVWH